MLSAGSRENTSIGEMTQQLVQLKDSVEEAQQKLQATQVSAGGRGAFAPPCKTRRQSLTLPSAPGCVLPMCMAATEAPG